MFARPSGRFVIRSLTLALGLCAIGCNKPNPVSPSPGDSTAAVAAAAPATTPATVAVVSQVLPASLPPSESPQTLLVEGSNFLPGLTVELVFTPTFEKTPAGVRRISGTTHTVSGPAIRHLTETSFEVEVMVRDVGTYRLCVKNPQAPPSDPVVVSTEPTDTTTPVVTGLSPASPTASSAPQLLSATGANFEEGFSVAFTRPNGQVMTVGYDAVPFAGPAQFQVNVTLADAGSYSMRVVNPSGPTSAPWTFTVKSGESNEAPPPFVSGISPESPTRGAQSQTLKITGGNFAAGLGVVLSGPGDDMKTIGGSAISEITPTSFQLSAVLANAGEYSLRVVNASGRKSAPRRFNVKAPEGSGPPTITQVEPDSLKQDTDARPLYVRGTNFQAGLVVKLTRPNSEGTTTIGEPAVTFNSSTVIRVMATLSSPGIYSLRVVNPSGQTSDPWTFTVKPAEAPEPAITGFSPESPTKSSASQVVTVNGRNFVQGLTVSLTKEGGSPDAESTMTAGESTIPVHNVTPTSFQMTVVLESAGRYKVRVTNPSGKRSEPRTLTVKAPEGAAPPTITGLQPSSLQASEQSRPLYVTGTNFQPGLVVKLTRPNGNTSVIGGSAITLASSTTLQVFVTLGAPGNYSLRVVNPQDQLSAPWSFTVAGGS